MKKDIKLNYKSNSLIRIIQSYILYQQGVI